MADRATERRPEGVTVRHGRGCASADGGRCRCQPAYQAQVFSPRDRRTIRKSFPSVAEARAWRADTKAALQKGTMRAATSMTLEEAADDWLGAARAGIARTRSGDAYKPSALFEATRRRSRPRSYPSSATCACRRSTGWRSRT
jgi:integrase